MRFSRSRSRRVARADAAGGPVEKRFELSLESAAQAPLVHLSTDKPIYRPGETVFWRATVLEMTNHQTHKKTVIASSALFLNMALYKGKNGKPRKNLTAAQFTRQALESK